LAPAIQPTPVPADRACRSAATPPAEASCAPTTDPRVARARAQRDRFVAFAFAGADLLLELDHDGLVQYARGSSLTLLGLEADELHGQPLAFHLAERDRPLLENALTAVRKARLGPIAVTAASGRRLMANAIELIPPRIHLVLSANPQPDPRAAKGAVDREWDLLTMMALRELAATHLTAEEGDETAILVLTALDGLDRLEDGADLHDVRQQIAAVLRLCSLGGDAAAVLGNGRFALVCEPSLGAEEVALQLQDKIGAMRLKDRLAVRTSELALADSMLSAQEGREALRHVLANFAMSIGEAPHEQPQRLRDALVAGLAVTKQRIAEFRDMVSRLDFSLVFQPVVTLADRSIVHYEALSRLRGQVEPGEAIRFAEDVGIIADFDLAVCEKVALALRAGVAEEVAVAVNVSARSLANDAFVQRLRRLLGALGPLARRVLFELTETFAVSDLARIDQVLASLRQDGHLICLDDFGAGASAFHYARNLTVDFIKVDGSYIGSMLSNPSDQAIVRSIHELSRSLGIRAIAEMVETEAQLALIREIGLELGQGWLFGKPLERLPWPAKAGPAGARPIRRAGGRPSWV
jgi:EAL domain-containing protein (putative c-di-GMP-specific phosphodiesterase class I)